MGTLHLQSNGTKEIKTFVNRYIQEKHGSLVRPRQVIVGCIPVLRVILSGPLQPLCYSKLVSSMLGYGGEGEGEGSLGRGV